MPWPVPQEAAYERLCRRSDFPSSLANHRSLRAHSHLSPHFSKLYNTADAPVASRTHTLRSTTTKPCTTRCVFLGTAGVVIRSDQCRHHCSKSFQNACHTEQTLKTKSSHCEDGDLLAVVPGG